MTREEAKELKDKIYRVDFDYEGDDLIDKIYDDFENEIKEKTKWHKIEDGDFPSKRDGEQIYLCQIADNNGKLKDPLLRCYYCGEFVNHISLKSMSYNDNVIAWCEIPNYEKK